MIKIYPSLIAADLLNLESEIKKLEPYSDGFHLDIMDFHFVPNLGLSIDTINQISEITKKQLWVHLMVEDPSKYLEKLKLKNGDIFSFHIESNKNIATLIADIEEKNLKSGLSLNPETDYNMIKPYTSQINHITLMSVHPGFCGQRFLDATYDKLEDLVVNKEERNLQFSIGIDGGVNESNLAKLKQFGATEFVIGSALFKSSNPIKFLENIKKTN